MSRVPGCTSSTSTTPRRTGRSFFRNAIATCNSAVIVTCLSAPTRALPNTISIRKRSSASFTTWLAGTESVRRLADGRTVVGCNQHDPGKNNVIAFYEFDRENQLLRSARFPGLSGLRLFRLSSRGTLLFGANGKFVVEGTFDGKILRRLEIKDASHVYHFFERPDGHLLLSGGYGSFVAELDANGKELQRWGGKPGPAEIGFHFFGSVQRLKDGRIIVANWTGHGAKTAKKVISPGIRPGRQIALELARREIDGKHSRCVLRWTIWIWTS